MENGPGLKMYFPIEHAHFSIAMLVYQRVHPQKINMSNEKRLITFHYTG